MVTCEQCDAPVSGGDSFCGECGAFLDWSDPPPAPAETAGAGPDASPVPGPDTAPAPAPPAAGLPEDGPDSPPGSVPPAGPVPASPPQSAPGAGPEPPPASASGPAPGAEPASASPAGAVPEAAGGAASTAGADPTGTPGQGDGGAGDASGADSARAAALLAPAPRGTPRPRPRPGDRPRRTPAAPSRTPGEQPVAVRPGREAVRRPRVRAVADEYVGSPDDVACSGCGTANPAERSFCRRCGAPLGGTRTAETRPPWWRRLRWRRTPRRRGPAGRLRRPLTWLALLLAVVALGWAATVYGPSAVDALRDRFSKPKSVRPVTVTASSSAPGHPAELAVDGAWNRFWAPAAGREPGGQWLEASFGTSFRLTDLVFHPGSSDRADEYLKQARPASLTVTAWDGGGRKVGERTVTLEDKPGEQAVRLTLDGVSRVRLTIRSAHGQRPSRLMALGEVEFFRRA